MFRFISQEPVFAIAIKSLAGTNFRDIFQKSRKICDKNVDFWINVF